MKKMLKALGILLLVVVLAAAGLILWLSVAEFKPAPVENVEVSAVGALDQVDSEE